MPEFLERLEDLLAIELRPLAPLPAGRDVLVLARILFGVFALLVENADLHGSPPPFFFGIRRDVKKLIASVVV